MDAVEHAQTGAFWSSVNSSFNETLSGDDGGLVEVLHSVEGVVSVFHLVHVPGGGSYVWSRDVDAWSDEVVLHEFDGVTTHDSFDFAFGELGLVHADSSLGSAVRDFYYGEF